MDSSAAAGSEEVCIINIGPRERAKRMRFGLVALAISLAMAALLVTRGAPTAYRLLLFVPLFIAVTGIFQAREKT